jgi:hypothetical protein
VGTLAAGTVVSVSFPFSDLGVLKKEAFENVVNAAIAILKDALATYPNINSN